MAKLILPSDVIKTISAYLHITHYGINFIETINLLSWHLPAAGRGLRLQIRSISVNLPHVTQLGSV